MVLSSSRWAKIVNYERTLGSHIPRNHGNSDAQAKEGIQGDSSTIADLQSTWGGTIMKGIL